MGRFHLPSLTAGTIDRSRAVNILVREEPDEEEEEEDDDSEDGQDENGDGYSE